MWGVDNHVITSSLPSLTRKLRAVPVFLATWPGDSRGWGRLLGRGSGEAWGGPGGDQCDQAGRGMGGTRQRERWAGREPGRWAWRSSWSRAGPALWPGERVWAWIVSLPTWCDRNPGEKMKYYPHKMIRLCGVLAALTFLTSSRDDVTGPALLTPGVITFLPSGSPGPGSPAFLAKSLRAAAKVDLELVGGEEPGSPPGLPGEGEDGTDWGLTLERSEIKEIKVSIPSSYEERGDTTTWHHAARCEWEMRPQ